VGSAQRPGASPWSARAEATLNGSSSGAASCSWCDRPFQLRQSGGHAQRFCSPHCRLAFHDAARRCVLEAIEAGVLTIDHIRKGVQPTCTLPDTVADDLLSHPRAAGFYEAQRPQAHADTGTVRQDTGRFS
jgi:hypothetical protein